MRHVADGDRDALPAWLGTQLGDHRVRQLEAVDLHATLCERQGDAACPDGELQDAAAVGLLDQEVDRGLDDLVREHRLVGLVVALCHRLAEVAVRVRHASLTDGKSGHDEDDAHERDGGPGQRLAAQHRAHHVGAGRLAAGRGRREPPRHES